MDTHHLDSSMKHILQLLSDLSHTAAFFYLAHVEGEAEEDQVQSAPLHQHA